MVIQVNIDGCPYIVEFEGLIDIERMWDGETVAIRGTGISVKPDEEAMRLREANRSLLWHGLPPFARVDLPPLPWFRSCGGSKVREGYD
jgi:hypothetical protein